MFGYEVRVPMVVQRLVQGLLDGVNRLSSLINRVRRVRFTPKNCAELREHALVLSRQGESEAGERLLGNVIPRLEGRIEQGTHWVVELAETRRTLARLLLDDAPVRAVTTLEAAVKDYRRLGEARMTDLAATLDQLAEAQERAGRYQAVLDTAEHSLALHQARQDHRAAALLLSRLAEVAIRQRDLDGAEQQFTRAMAAAANAGDHQLRGEMLRQRGILQRRRRHYEQALDSFQAAIAAFRAAADAGAEMRTWDLLATTQVHRGDLDNAHGSYARGRELAERLEDRFHLAINAQHLGILHQKRAEQTVNPDIRATLLHQAAEYLRESLAIKLDMNNRPGVEASYYQLGVLFWKMGDLEQGEHYLRRATALAEDLRLAKVYKNYSALAMIARERNDVDAASLWQAKCDGKVAELKSRRF